MDQQKLWFVLLLPLCLCFDTEEVILKTIGREPDVTPICTAATRSIITQIECNIRTERNRGEECSLLYLYQHHLEHKCDSRFKLTMENQTVFLRLTSLTPQDSGDYTCNCSHAHGTHTLYLKVKVKGEARTSPVTMLMSTAVIGSSSAFLVVTGVVLGLILRRNNGRDRTGSGPSGPPACETPCSLVKGDPENLYAGLQQPSGDLYQSILSVRQQPDTKMNSAGNNTATARLEQETNASETDQSCKIYENV